MQLIELQGVTNRKVDSSEEKISGLGLDFSYLKLQLFNLLCTTARVKKRSLVLVENASADFVTIPKLTH